MIKNRFIERYVTAFYENASSINVLPEIIKDAHSFIEICNRNRDFIVFLKNPIIRGEKKLTVIKDVFAKSFNSNTIKFIELVIFKNRESELLEIFKGVISKYKEENNIVVAEVVTAVPINEAVKNHLLSFISKISGYKGVELSNKVDENIIGGFRLKYNDKLMDSSVSYELEKLRKELFN